MKVVILKNEMSHSEDRWVKACQNRSIDFSVIDLSRHDWLEQIRLTNPDLLLTRPSGLTAPFKLMYDERLEILVKELNIPCFPTLEEVKIYENKRYFSYWLNANNLPHSETLVFYFEKEAMAYAGKQVHFPLVAKTNIGASGSGVVILENKNQLTEYIQNTFHGTGSEKRVGPNLKKGKILQRGFKLLLNPKRIILKYNTYKARAFDSQTDFVLFQEYIPHDFEWRVVRIGDSFFAHKKLLLGKMTSGSLTKEYSNPPLKLLDFVKELTDKFNFKSQAVDLFESSDGNYLINEMQCIFGQSDTFQMKVDGVIGKYIMNENSWEFLPGDFNSNESFNLRLDAALDYFHSINK
jgi:hypothetical protein